MQPIIEVAAGVPFVALPPAERSEDAASLVVVWHMTDAPRSERAMAAALPLNGLRAWRVYLGLPLCGSRLPVGGLDEFFRLGYEDAVLNLFEPMNRQAVDEFPPALADLRERLAVEDGPVALVGASAGAFVAQSVLAETDIPVRAVALISPAIPLSSVVAAKERRFGMTYKWRGDAVRAAETLDFVARSDEIARRGVDVLLALGALDDEDGFHAPARQLWQALSDARRRSGGADLIEIPGMGHALAEEPGLDPAPQTPHALRVDAAVTDWLARRLGT